MSPNTSNSLVNLGGNLGDLSKPAITLIKKMSNAVGGLFAPYQIKRIAKAEAEAALIKAQSDIEITDLHRRAARRWIEEEAQHQENMESITARALPELNEDAKPESMDDDWIVNFLDKGRIVSDSEMQELWSRILAGEANKPGTYSKRAVNSLSDIDKTDADLFTKFCGFVWMIEKTPMPLIFGKVDRASEFWKGVTFKDLDSSVSPAQSFADIYSRNNINFDNLMHLDSIGMIRFNGTVPVIKFDIPEKLTASYYDKSLILKFPVNDDSGIGLYLGRARLTNVGKQFAPICKSKPVEGFYEYVKDKWKQYLPESEREQ